MCLFRINGQSIIHETAENHGFRCHNCNHKAVMKQARGQNKLFQNASLLMYCCSFENGQIKLIKTQSEIYAIDLLFKVQIRLDHPNTN